MNKDDKLLRNVQYEIQLRTGSSPNKYPAKQHARAVGLALNVPYGMIYLAGAPTTFLEDSDQNAPFRQRRYFSYLSGCDEADCHLLYDIARDKLMLFIPKIDFRKAVWGGAGSTLEEAEEFYDVDDVMYVTDLKMIVSEWDKKGEGPLFVLHPDQTVESFLITRMDIGEAPIDTTSLKRATDRCRVIKDDHEIELIRRANQISADAHRSVLENIRTFSNESQVAAIFLDTSVAEGAKNQAYNIIAGSGVNAAVLHYVKNDESLKGRELLLLDAGAEWQCYASDVTRTFPLSGSWSTAAKNIYDIVAEMQDACISRFQPGVHFRDLHVLAHYIAVTGLLELGILHNGSCEEILHAGTSLAFFPHGLGHHVGLEVHDVIDLPLAINDEGQTQRERESSDNPRVFQSTSLADKDPSILAALYNTLIHPSTCMTPVVQGSMALQPGMVVTVEPGIYFSQYALNRVYLPNPVHAKYINKEVLAKYLAVGGVRIEDDILVTSNGYENLTTAPKGEEALEIIRGCWAY